MAQVKCSECGAEYSSSATVCPQCGCPNDNYAPEINYSDDDLGKQFFDALLHFLYRIVYFLFVLPFGLWKNAVVRMSKARRTGSLDVTSIKTDYPFLSWLKRFLFEFLFDAVIVVIWIVGVIVAIVTIAPLIKYGASFGHILGTFIGILYGFYVMPILVTISRDITTISVVMPIRWWISFLRRPAKTYDLTHEGKIQK